MHDHELAAGTRRVRVSVGRRRRAVRRPARVCDPRMRGQDAVEIQSNSFRLLLSARDEVVDFARGLEDGGFEGRMQ